MNVTYISVRKYNTTQQEVTSGTLQFNAVKHNNFKGYKTFY